MGNAQSNAQTKKRGAAAQQWDWNWTTGRPVPVAKRGGGHQKRPLFKKQPSDNYDLWIFNPDNPVEKKTREKKSTARR